jgi:hypothetical protein
MDPVVSKMLYMHAPSLSPGAFLELELSPMVQSAALLGLGLLFRGSCHRCCRSSQACMEKLAMEEAAASGNKRSLSPAWRSEVTAYSAKRGAVGSLQNSYGVVCRRELKARLLLCRLTAELMMEEIGRRPTSIDTTCASTNPQGSAHHPEDREGYAWSAALGLGLITLGKGRRANGLADMRIEQRLRHAPLSLLSCLICSVSIMPSLDGACHGQKVAVMPYQQVLHHGEKLSIGTEYLARRVPSCITAGNCIFMTPHTHRIHFAAACAQSFHGG